MSIRFIFTCLSVLIKCIFAINSNDNYLLTKLNCNVVELKNKFYGDELSMSEKAQDSFGLARRKYGQTNIDYLLKLRTCISAYAP